MKCVQGRLGIECLFQQALQRVDLTGMIFRNLQPLAKKTQGLLRRLRHVPLVQPPFDQCFVEMEREEVFQQRRMGESEILIFGVAPQDESRGAEVFEK